MDVKTQTVDYPLQPLYELPDLVEPAPVVSEQDSTCLALIPIFTDRYSRGVNVYAYTKAAIYSRMLCLAHSDAVAQGVSVKLYIENHLEPILKPVLEANAINLDTDVIWFSAPPLGETREGSWGRLGKKMVSYWDNRFKDYEWVISWDADLFWLPDAWPFFEKLKSHPKQIGYIRKCFSYDWERRLERSTAKGGLPVDKLLQMADIPKHLKQQDRLESVVAYLWCYPAKHFYNNHPDFIEWMWNYAPYLGDDEICNALCQKKFGLEIFDISKTFFIITRKVSDYIKKPEYHCSLIHGRPKTEPQQIEAFRNIVGVT